DPRRSARADGAVYWMQGPTCDPPRRGAPRGHAVVHNSIVHRRTYYRHPRKPRAWGVSAASDSCSPPLAERGQKGTGRVEKRRNVFPRVAHVPVGLRVIQALPRLESEALHVRRKMLLTRKERIVGRDPLSDRGMAHVFTYAIEVSLNLP